MKKYISTILACLLVFQLFRGGQVSPVYAANYDLAINKVVLTPSPYASGDVVSYRLTIENQGTVDFGSNITINDYLSDGALFGGSWSSSEPSVTLSSPTGQDTITWDLPFFFPTETITIDYSVNMISGGTMHNRSEILPGGGDPGESVPYATGTCTPGHNPLVGDYAVAGTNNVDCEEINVDGDPLTGDCGTITSYYDLEGNGTSLINTTPGLCDIGAVFGFSYNTHNWSWQCVGIYGGGNVNCNATELYCSDSILQISDGEQCEDGDQTNGDGCNSICLLEGPACALTPDSSEIYINLPLGYTISNIDPSWEEMTSLSYGDGIDEGALTAGNYSYAHTYQTGGAYTATLVVTNTISTGIVLTGVCQANIDVTYCSDSITNGPEECDDGNFDNSDGCINTCIYNVCGDGYQWVPVEACDDGNGNDNDACKNDCTDNVCGDGVEETGVEECDDGNPTNTDACTNACNDNICGDGIIHTGVEECDDSNFDENDACKNDCSDNVCGDGVLETGVEECDDGNVINGDGCTDVCIIAFCGDGIVEPGSEDCDDANANDNDACKNDCTDNVCGDAVIETGVEDCDDGNGINTDACKNDCSDNVCGDTVIETGVEDCDDGNGINTDACKNDCSDNVCGDTVVETGVEDCDDGNGINTDACKNDCTDNVCGDAVIETGVEDCDDGNGINTDACTNVCTNATCGDNIIQTGVEQCDDGNAVNTDACTNTCNTAVCGDSIIRAGVETCDDGNGINTDACTNACLIADCGDGIVQTGVEECDDSNATNTDACTNACTNAVCGDSIVRAGVEACDDGNLNDNDGCRNTCQTATCGDGVVQSGTEECDDGNLVTTDACTNLCTDAVCGDAIVQAGVEGCDDGNAVNTDACTNSCAVAVCGDGVVRAGVEACDDGNGSNTDACTNTCVAAVCGDGFTRTGVEQCDDANQNQQDACKNNCTNNVCGDAVIRTGVETCDDGNLIATDACTSSCLTAVCGDGFVRTGVELCDDSNTIQDDGCGATCTFELPYCNLTVAGEGNPPANVQIDENLATSKPRINVTTLDRGDASPVVNAPVFPINHIYATTSAYYAQAEAINSLPGASLFSSCTVLVEIGVTCGNGLQETGEGCDDGNLVGNDGCSAICQLEGCTIPTAYNYDAQAIIDNGSCEYCGDGLLQNGEGETCDDGNQNNGDSCTADCLISAEILSTYNRGGSLGNRLIAGLQNKGIIYRLKQYEQAATPRATRPPRYTTQSTSTKEEVIARLVGRSLQEHTVAPVSTKQRIQDQLKEYTQWKLLIDLF